MPTPNPSTSASAWARPNHQNLKRQGPSDSHQEPTRKKRRGSSLEKFSRDPPQQLPSPLPSGYRRRKADTLAADNKAPKRSKKDTYDSGLRSRINNWLSQLPTDRNIRKMDEPPKKRSRSSDPSVRARSPSVPVRSPSISSQGSSAPYADPRYASRLQKKGSVLRESASGISEDDKRMCNELLECPVVTPLHTMFDDMTFGPFCDSLKGRSELRVSLDVHNLLVASAENLWLRGVTACERLVQGHNDSWSQTHPFCGPVPQPDQTVGFKLSAFGETELRKLEVDESQKSDFTAREDIFFPFLTIEVKSSNASLNVADRQNAHSMTIALRGLIELYRKSGREAELNGRILTFSISHNESEVRLYGHYAEVAEGKINYFRHAIREYKFTDKHGEERWLCYRFSYNVLVNFSAELLVLIKSGIKSIPEEPLEEPLLSFSQLDESASCSQEDDRSRQSSQGRGKGGSRSTGGSTHQRAILQQLESFNEKQREESKVREEKLLEQMNQQRQEFREQMDQQREEFKEREERLLQLLARPK